MADLASLDIKTFMFGVGFQVFEETDNVSYRLFRPSTVVMFVDLAHGLSTWTSSESSEWNNGGVINNSLHILDSFVDVETSACSSSLISVFKMDSLIVRSALSSYRRKMKIRKGSYIEKLIKITSQKET
jgi:hypothetical protein